MNRPADVIIATTRRGERPDSFEAIVILRKWWPDAARGLGWWKVAETVVWRETDYASREAATTAARRVATVMRRSPSA